MAERPAKAGLVVAELALGDAEVLAGGGDLGRVSAGKPVEGVEHGTRAVGIAGKLAWRVVAPSRYASAAPDGLTQCRIEGRDIPPGGTGGFRAACPGWNSTDGPVALSASCSL